MDFCGELEWRGLVYDKTDGARDALSSDRETTLDRPFADDSPWNTRIPAGADFRYTSSFRGSPGSGGSTLGPTEPVSSSSLPLLTERVSVNGTLPAAETATTL